MNSEVSNKKFFDTVRVYIENKTPFVVYRMPKSKVLCFKTGDTSFGSLKDKTRNSFFFMPFNKSFGYTISEDLSFQTLYSVDDLKRNSPVVSSENILSQTEKTKYLEAVKLLVEKIKSTRLKKIVFSKKISINFSSSKHIELYKNILGLYANAFCYLFYHPSEGFWTGASPELLFKKEKKELITMALAGTKFNSQEGWTKKEIEEQQIVKNEIYNNLVPLCSELSAGETITSQAGNLQHLETLFKGKSNASILEIIDALFPTSAIAGFPKKIALPLISEYEKHDRSFYSGFLGSIENSLAYSFVNLRCLNLKSNQAHIYVGSGLTKDSVPLSEWNEILKKSETMLSALY